ncbi:MAG: VWA domain-containing protein [Rhodospirillales bacterium]|nr:VWA domain-containing protein [Rhodospirillales bacterium]
MASRLRIARLEPSAYVPLASDAAATSELHGRLQAVIRRHLPPITASLFAAPAPTADGRFVEWYSDLAGQPVPLPRLPEADRDAARSLLHDRLSSLRELAERLPAVDPNAADLALPLRQALAYPSDDNVFVVGGQPVITFWGHGAASGAPPAGLPPGTAVAADDGAPGVRPPGVPPTGVSGGPSAAAASGDAAAASGRGGMAWWLWLLVALALAAALAVGAWWYFRDLRWPPWVDYQGLYEAAVDEEARLQQEVDRLESGLRQRLQRCALQGDLMAAVSEEAALLERVDVLQTEVVRALELCPLRRQVETAAADGAALGGRVGELEATLAETLEACRRAAEEAERLAAEQARRGAEEEARRKAEADAERRREETARRQAQQPPPAAAVPPPTTPPGLPPCPGERPPEDAPDVAIVLDSSGSMSMPANMSATNIMGGILGGLLGLPGGAIPSGPSRLQSAKEAVNKVVGGLPTDVDVGLAVLEDCPRARNYGFFPGSDRQRLYRTVSGLQPMKQTPLADGISQAGSMVDGVRAPAVIVVVSDGRDTCRGDPCAVARALKSRKPKLTINVVDIVGDGASNCIARATGGRVLTPQSGMAFEQTIKKATEEAQKPAHCK